MSANFCIGFFIGPCHESSRLYMRRALLRDAGPNEPGLVLAQFDDRDLEEDGVQYGFGWHYFLWSDFTSEDAD